MITTQDLEEKIAVLKNNLSKEKSKNKKVKIEKEIKTLTNNLGLVLAYEQINIGDFVVNGNSSKIGTVTSKEIQNTLPVVWVDWNGLKISSVPNCLTIIPPKQLQWQWIEGDFTRLYDHKSCDDIRVLFEELKRLKLYGKLLNSENTINRGRRSGNGARTKQLTKGDTSISLDKPLSPASPGFSSQGTSDLSSSPIEAIKKNKLQQEKIIKLWGDAISCQFPLRSGFLLHNRKVTVKSYQLSKQHDLVFPIVFDGQTKHLAHPFELKKIPLGQINLFPDDNTDKKEPPDPDDLIAKKEKGNLIIDPEFKSVIPPLTPEEKKQLEETLIKEGCRDALLIWKNHNILIDGHNRYEICTKHNIKYRTVEIEISDRDSVINWMLSNQLSRRNLNEDVAAYLRGKLYRNLKKKHGGDRNKSGINQHTEKLINDSSSSGHSDHLTNGAILQGREPRPNLAPKTLETSLEIAKNQGVSEATVRRDAKYSEAVESIAKKVNLSPQDIINSKLSKKQIKEIVNLPVESIKAKLENSSFIDPNEFPEFKVGDVVQIKSDRKNGCFVGYNGNYAIVDTVYENSCDIRFWQQLITHVSKHFLTLVERDTVTLKLTLPKYKLQELMTSYDRLEDAISKF